MFKVYWTLENGEVMGYEVEGLEEALGMTEMQRKAGRRFVTMASEDPNSVGKLGVDSVVDGKTPDGEVYDWSKAGRAGKMRPSDFTKEHIQK